MNINRKAVELWVEALESGKYQQTKGVLHNADDDTFCCLGVACKLAMDRGLVNRIRFIHYAATGPELAAFEYGTLARYDHSPEHKYLVDANGLSLPFGVQAWLGLPDSLGYITPTQFANSLSRETVEAINAEYTGFPIPSDGRTMSLAELNDHGVSFATIARVIRELWLDEEGSD